MERKIGEIFEFKKEWYQCVEGRCKDCHFSEKRYLCKQFITKDFCTNGIIFKKLEKVGEPYTHYCPSGRIIYFQRYKIFNKSYSHNTEYIMCDFNEDDIVSIELKQTKEDMEEKKIQLKREDIDYLTRKIRYLVYKTNDYDRATEEIMNLFIPSDTEHSSSEKIGKNLKPFDLEAAKAGKPVCTRDGHKARIICFDYNGETGDYPIVALVHYNKGNKCYERVLKYTSDGLFNKYGDCRHDDDLMMLPEKKEGWANVYDDTPIYDSKEEALNRRSKIRGYIDTVKVSWEE